MKYSLSAASGRLAEEDAQRDPATSYGGVPAFSCTVLTKYTLSFTYSGVAVGLRVTVAVGVRLAVGVRDGVRVNVGVRVIVGVRVTVGVREAVGVLEAVGVELGAGVLDGFGVEDAVGVPEGGGVLVIVGVFEGGAVLVAVSVTGTGVGVLSPRYTKRTASAPSSRSPTTPELSCVPLPSSTYSAEMPSNAYLPAYTQPSVE